MPNLHSLLQIFSKDTESIQSHLNFNGGKYSVPWEKEEEFLTSYYQELVKQNNNLFLIEKVSSKFAYFQDIDSKDNITDEEIVALIKDTIDHAHVFFVLNSSDGKDLEYAVSKRMNKFHINYPNLIVDTNTAITFTQAIIEKTKNIGIDKSVYKTGLRMLGSRKNPRMPADKDEQSVYRLYDIELHEFKEDIMFSDFQKTLIRRNDATPLAPLSEIGNTLVSKQTPSTKVKGQVSGIVLEEIKELIKVMRDEHESIQHFDLTIVKALHVVNRIGLGCFYLSISDRFCPFMQREHSRTSNPMYIELSKKGIVLRCFDEECKKKTYPNQILRLPDEKEISECYPNMYRMLYVSKWNTQVQIDDRLQEILEQGLTCTHYRLAKVLFKLYRDKFRVDEVRNGDWYEFDGTRWKKSFRMQLNVSEEIPKYYQALKQNLTKEASGIEDVGKEESSSVQQCIGNVIKKLENVSFKTNVLQDAKYLFFNHDIDFAKKLDSNPMLIGFENGVYDLETFQFRPGRMDDYITFTTGYDYFEYDENDPHVQEIFEFLEKILTNKEVREYTLKVLGKALLGVADEKFYIWTGLSGANGKSTLVNFLEMTLGEYAGTQDVALLTNKRPNSNAATPEVVEMRGKRMIFFQEPETQDKLRTGILKQYTGGDTIKARELFKSPVSFKCQAAFIMCCNDLPPVNSLDGGTWRRIRVTEFKSKFCENPTKPNEFKIDPKLRYKLKTWRPYFMSILLHYQKKQAEEGIFEPAAVKEATNRYKTENDKFNDYFEECLAEETDTFNTNNDIFTSFEEWWKMNYSVERVPTKTELRKALRNKFGEEQERMVFSKKQKGHYVRIKPVVIDEAVASDDLD